MQFTNFGITSEFFEGKMVYRPLVKGEPLHHLFNTEEEAIIFAIAQYKLKNINEARYVTEFINRMLTNNRQ